MDRYEALLATLRAEFPRLAIVAKDASIGQRAIHGALIALTAGRMRRYLHDYQTTIGSTIYVTPDWDARSADERFVILRHEAVHLRQFRRWTLPGMAVLYVLVPLPAGLAWCRMRFEQEAYAETIRAAHEVWGDARVRDPAFRRRILDQFVGPAYGWMWPFRVYLERWYDRILSTLR